MSFVASGSSRIASPCKKDRPSPVGFLEPDARTLPFASASTSTTSPPSATPAAGGIPTRSGPRMLAVLAGADGITAHLREDRRHIGDDDIERLKRRARRCRSTSRWRRPTEMVAIALAHPPHAACLVPEKREERTTEGGLDVVGGHNASAPVVARAERRRHPRLALHRAGPAPARRAPARSARRSSSCIPAPIARPSIAGDAERAARRARAARAGPPRMAPALGLEVHAGHGLDYDTVGAGRRHPGDRRAQHRPFPDRRGDLRRARRGDPHGCGPLMDAGRAGAGAERPMILGIGTTCATSAGSRSRSSASATASSQRIFTEIERARRSARDARRQLRQALRRQGGLRQGARHRPAPGVFWRDMGVVNLRSGKPTMALTGGALARLQEITPAGMGRRSTSP